MMLHQEDEKMLLLDNKNPNSVFCLDLNRTDVIEEWKTESVLSLFLLSFFFSRSILTSFLQSQWWSLQDQGSSSRKQILSSHIKSCRRGIQPNRFFHH